MTKLLPIIINPRSVSVGVKVLLTMMFTSSALSSSANSVTDAMAHRWFDIEVVVFERLSVLDINTEEQLAQSKPRMWPANLELFGHVTKQTTQSRPDYTQYCFGNEQQDRRDARGKGWAANTLGNLSRNARRLLPGGRDTPEQISQPESATRDGVNDDNPDNAVSATPQPQPNPQDVQLAALKADIAAHERALFRQSYLPRDDLSLIDKVRALNRQRNLRPILHQRWRMPVPPRDAPAPLYIRSQTTPNSPDTIAGFAKLEGAVSVTVGRYLHFAADLWYNADTVGAHPIAFPPSPAAFKKLETTAGNQIIKYMELSESRRLRSGDLHYLDHPKLGVLVLIEPVEVPEDMQSRWDGLGDDALSLIRERE